MLVFHGYLLRGTGSNVYNANLAAALVALGHEVHLVCQDRRAAELAFVGSVADWDAGELRVTRLRDAGCTVYRPDIGGLLPVYVRDRYEGLEARPFEELTDDELDAYLLANVRAVQEVVTRSGAEVALANHLVMGPAILSRALAATRIPYAVKIHGSALEYTVKPHPRFLPYAREGIADAKTILVGSRHVAESLWAVLADDSLPARTRLGPPGVDIELFQPRERGDARVRVRTVAKRIAAEESKTSGDQSAFSRDAGAGAAALSELANEDQARPVIAFVGKLIVSKGIDLLLAAWPLVVDQVPEARLAVIGFGAYREAVERWIDALSRKDLDAIRELAERGREAEGGKRSKLDFVLAFLERLRDPALRERYLSAAAMMSERTILTGRVEHEELAEVLPLCQAIVVPSTFPESFGMVAVEAAACGVLPISAAHSGLAEVSRVLARELPAPAGELMSFSIGTDVVEAIAGRVVAWLRTSAEVRSATRAGLVQIARTRYSWEGVARGVIAAARGEHDALEPVSSS